MRRILAALAALLVVLSVAGPALAKPAIWTVRDGNSTLILFGSVHILPPGLDWRPQALNDALAKADDLWFEIPMDTASQAEASSAVLDLGRLPPGETLDGLLPKATAAALDKAVAKAGLKPEQIQGFKPWLADTVLGLSDAAAGDQAGAASGVEMAISASAPASARRRAFETARQQIAMFNSMPMKAQIASLQDTLSELDKPTAKTKDEYDKLVDAWMRGDLAALQKLGPDDLGKTSPALYKTLLIDRNSAWMKQIEARLTGSGTTVVVVGAGHLLGEDGLPARLRALGYRVDGP